MATQNVSHWLSLAATRLEGASATPRLDAEILLSKVMGKDRTWLRTWPEVSLDEQQYRQFERLLDDRVSGVPVAYLTGEQEFWSLPLQVNEHVLIPRPETELIVELVVGMRFDSAAMNVLDLGTGSGALALALKSEYPDWRVLAVDASESALSMARNNARRLGLDVGFLLSDWFDAIAEQSFDLIVSNPPYIGPDDHHLSEGDLRFEPAGALIAQENGLADIRQILMSAGSYLTPGGLLMVEHGCEQGRDVCKLFDQAGFDQVTTEQDLAGLDRVTHGRWPGGR